MLQGNHVFFLFPIFLSVYTFLLLASRTPRLLPLSNSPFATYGYVYLGPFDRPAPHHPPRTIQNLVLCGRVLPAL